MNYSEYYSFDTTNGDGVRCTLFISGCSHHCEGCFNKETWKFSAGEHFTQQMQDQVIKDLSNPYIDGLSLLGGDPLHPRNAAELLPFLQRVKKELPDKSIWCWTGYKFEDLKKNLIQEQCLWYLDYVVDGKFVKELYEPDLLFRGSLNQRIIDVKKSLTTDQIFLYNNGNYK